MQTHVSGKQTKRATSNQGVVVATEPTLVPSESVYVRHLLAVLRPYRDQGLSRIETINRVRELREHAGFNIPTHFASAVQSAFNSHNEQSRVFQRLRRPPVDNLFCSVAGLGSGIWAAR